MQFKHPEILYALLLLVIPIIVHLFQLRKFKKQAFTNVAFLKKVTRQTRKSSQIKKWLTLIVRLLIFSCIILAFTQPYTSKTSSFSATPETVIYIDNSFSTQAKGPKGELLKRAVQELIDVLNPDDYISIVTNDAVYKNTNLKAIQNDLLKLDYSATQLPYDAALLKSSKLFSSAPNRVKNLVFISDFQEKENKFSPKTDADYALNVVKLEPVNTKNASIDSVYVEKMNLDGIRLKVAINKNKTELENLTISLLDGDKLLAKNAVSASNNQVVDFTITDTAITNGKIVLEDTGLQFDNTLYFNIDLHPKIKVLSIHQSEPSNYIERLFASNEFALQTTSLSQLNYSVLNKQQLIIVNELERIPSALGNALNTFINQGGYVVVIPSEELNIENYNEFLVSHNMNINKAFGSEKRLTQINYAHPLYEHVFEKQETNFQYPKASLAYSVSSTSGTVPLKFEDGKPFLTLSNQLALFSAPLNSKNSNFNKYDLVVPTFYNLARQSFKKPKLFYTIGKNTTFDVPVTLRKDGVLTLSLGSNSFIPQQQYYNDKVTVTTTDIPNTAGVYTLTNGNQVVQHVSYNYGRLEGKLNYQDLSSLKNVTISESVSSVFKAIKSDTKINALWKWFIIFAIAFLIIEMLILKYFK